MKKQLSTALAVIFCATVVFTGCSKDDEIVRVAGVTISPNALTLKPGTKNTLTVTVFPDNAAEKKVTWASSDTSVVKVDATGIITAVKPGASQVTVTTKDGNETASCAVTVETSDPISVKGEVSGVWKEFSVIHVDGQVNVPAGKTLTIERGVQVIISTAGQDASDTKIEFLINGNLYCYGSAADPVLFSVSAASRTSDNTFARLWGGIIGTTTCAEILLDHTIVEYTGAITTTTSPSATSGLFKAAGGEGMVAFNTNNPSGKYVVINSIFRNTGEDAIYVQGGTCIFSNNTFYAVGNTGGEAINVKAGCKVDAACNVMYSPNTNAFKLSNSGSSSTRYQAQINAYNNTIINAGWRRAPNDPKGGSVYCEKGALVNVFNNLIVNCMFGVKAPSFKVNNTAGPDLNSVIDYNYYASDTVKSTIVQHITNGTVTAYDGFKAGVKDVVYGTHDKAGTGVGLNDPSFVNFPFISNPILSYSFNSAWDFHLKAESPALTGGTTAYSPYFSTTGITVDGKEYKSPTPSVYFGAFGQQ